MNKDYGLIENTKMTAETGLMVIEIEYNSEKTEIEEVSKVINAVLYESLYNEAYNNETGTNEERQQKAASSASETIDKLSYYVLDLKEFSEQEVAQFEGLINKFNELANVQNIADKTGLTKARVQKIINIINGKKYEIQNVNLGLEERPRAQLVLDKAVTNVKLTLANGSILFDAKSEAANVLWRDHTPYKAIHETTPAYARNILVGVENERDGEPTEVGLIQLTMDEEIMHGATIKLDYDVTVKNIGDADYDDNKFYYSGANGATVDTNKVVTTSADKVIDYVANNMQFYYKDNEQYWKMIPAEKESATDTRESLLNELNPGSNLVNASLKDEIKKFNTIIITDKLKEDLIPEIIDEGKSSITVPLTLSQLITAENNSDDLTYKNIAEIVKTSNTVGRRMQFSVVGNQDPTQYPIESDADLAEVVRILPPFGETSNIVLISIVIIISIGIIVVGIIFIKKKILK